ncbi:MAG: hypothetical protein JMDDDDMK_05475 [Acidobacteria bacterium]|nr:hypothetical protein [Acidobacteriota bacterium]
MRDGFDLFALDRDVAEHGRGGQVVIPQPVMRCLKMPDALAGSGVQADDAFSKQVIAKAVAAVPVVGRRAGRQVDVAQLFIQRHRRPDVGVAGVLPRLILPGLRAELACLRDGVEDPDGFARAGVECLHVAARRFLIGRPVGDRRADNYHIAINHRRGSDGVIARINCQRDGFGEIDPALLAEVRDRLPRPGVERDQIGVARAQEDSFLFTVRPVSHAAMQKAVVGRASGFEAAGVIAPERPAGLRVERRHVAERRADVERAADHQRRRLVRVDARPRIRLQHLDVRRIPRPRDFEKFDVVLINLVERRILPPALVAAVIAPLAFADARSGLLLSRRRDGD